MGDCGDNIEIPSVSYHCTYANDSTLVGPVTLAYTFGLRHALDADHIAAIDNVSPGAYTLMKGMSKVSLIRTNSRDRGDFFQVYFK